MFEFFGEDRLLDVVFRAAGDDEMEGGDGGAHVSLGDAALGEPGDFGVIHLAVDEASNHLADQEFDADGRELADGGHLSLGEDAGEPWWGVRVRAGAETRKGRTPRWGRSRRAGGVVVGVGFEACRGTARTSNQSGASTPPQNLNFMVTPRPRAERARRACARRVRLRVRH